MIKLQLRKDRLSSDSAREISLRILDGLTEGCTLHRLNVRLWDGSYWPNADPKPATLVLSRPSALKEMLLSGTEAALGAAFLYQAFDIEGETEAAFELGDLILRQTEGWTKKLKLGFLLNRLPNREPKSEDLRVARLNGKEHSLERDREAIRFHYDLSNDFYALWLDRLMVYSCGYFKQETDDLDTAQANKLDHICRKLELKPGHRFLDIGCGWGGLAIHAAKHYGVRAQGITLSENQLQFARHRIADEGLQDRVTVELRDYRELNEPGTYDAIASVGMVEHVGRKKLPDYFQKAADLLKEGGLFLNHGIGLGPVPMAAGAGSFIYEFVFPDTDLLPIGRMLDSADKARLEVRDVESLREHYATTLRHWVKRLEARREESLQHVNEMAYRIWRLYMAGCAHGFSSGHLSIYQTLLAKLTSGGESRAPSTRAGWYTVSETD
jgi:cyclopropane-fatty-acyl-phospholipid synthase